MQQIERYGVIALVFLLVTIVAISFWGDSKSPGFWSRLAGKKTEAAPVTQATTPALPEYIAPSDLKLSEATPVPAPAPDATFDPAQPQVAGAEGTLIPGPAVVEPVLPLHLTPPVFTTPAPTPTVRADREYVVKSGDALARIARNELGAESRWQEIVALNPSVSDPRKLKPGMRLALPAGARAPSTKTAVAAKQPATGSPTREKPSASRTYTVKSGDTLRSIAGSLLGDADRWREIAALNPSISPSKLTIGKTLRLPEVAGGAQVAVVERRAPASGKPRIQ